MAPAIGGVAGMAELLKPKPLEPYVPNLGGGFAEGSPRLRADGPDSPLALHDR